MDIYNAEGTLDYARAANVLSGLTSLTNDAQATLKVQRVQAAALLDIAVSLNALAGIALNDFELGAKDERRTVDDPDDGEDERETADPEHQLDIGDRVEFDGPGGVGLAGSIRALGTSEGEEWADVAVDVDKDEAERIVRVFVRNLRTEPPASDARDLVDDLDADFGAAQPVECGAVMILEGVGTVGPCTKKPGHKARKHRDAEGREWLTEASDA